MFDRISASQIWARISQFLHLTKTERTPLPADEKIAQLLQQISDQTKSNVFLPFLTFSSSINLEIKNIEDLITTLNAGNIEPALLQKIHETALETEQLIQAKADKYAKFAPLVNKLHDLDAVALNQNQPKINTVVNKKLADAFSQDELDQITKIAHEMLKSPEAYIHRKKQTIYLQGKAITQFAMTKSGEKIYIHHKKLGSGATKTAKSIINLHTGERIARMTLHGKTHDAKTSIEAANREREIYGLTQGLEGVIQAKSVVDIKKSKATGEHKKGFLLEFLPSDMQSLVTNRSVPVKQKLGLMRQAAVGTKNLHDRGILHRDIKPENIMTDFDPTNPQQPAKAKIADLDLSLCRENDRMQHQWSESFHDEVTKYTTGTNGYLSPENATPSRRPGIISEAKRTPPVINGKKIAASDVPYELGKKMDVYSFGVSLKAVAYGLDPKTTSSSTKVTITENGKTTSFGGAKGDPSLPEGVKQLNSLIKQMTDSDPWSRPSMEEVIQCLAAIEGQISDSMTAYV